MSIGTDLIEREIESVIYDPAPTIYVKTKSDGDLTTPDLFLLHLTDAKAYLYGMKASGAISERRWKKIVQSINTAEFDLRQELILHRVSTAAADGDLSLLEAELDWEENANAQ